MSRLAELLAAPGPTPAEARPDERRILFGDLAQPVRFRGGDPLIAALGSILVGWDLRPAGPDAPRPGLRLSRTREGAWRRVSPRHATPGAARQKVRRGLVEAVCGFHYELIDWYAEEHPEQVFLHAAAAELGEGLVLLPAVSRAGKSTLSLYLALRGARCFGDDVLGVEATSAQGVALGMLPRLRRAAPGAESPALQAFVRRHRVLASPNRIYVDPGPGRVAPRGEKAPIAAVVLLDRRPRGPTRLTPLSPADALEALLRQAFGRLAAGPTLDTLCRVAGGARCLGLAYSDPARAADLLMRRLGAGGRP